MLNEGDCEEEEEGSGAKGSKDRFSGEEEEGWEVMKRVGGVFADVGSW